MKPKIIMVVGPTASGKTSLAVELAKRLDGEVVSADSMQIYRRMDIGTAKPTEEEKQGIPHHMIDIVEPWETFTLNDYLERADKVVRDILQRGKRVIFAGGTGLYTQSFKENLQLPEYGCDQVYRDEMMAVFAEKGGAYLKEMLEKVDPEAAARLHDNDAKRIIRALENYRATGKTVAENNANAKAQGSPYDFCTLGLNFEDRETLYERINRRVDLMMEQGLEEEVRRLTAETLSQTARQAIGYRQFFAYFAGEATLADTVETIKMESRRYAKRQLTWLRRDKTVEWAFPDRQNSEQILNFCMDTIGKFDKL